MTLGIKVPFEQKGKKSIYKFGCFTSVDGDHLSLNGDCSSKRVSFVQAKRLALSKCNSFVMEYYYYEQIQKLFIQ